MIPERLTLLIHKYLSNTASAEEEEELTSWYNTSNEKDIQWPVASEQEAAEIKGKILRKINQQIHPAAKVIPYYRRRGWQATAAILIILGAGAWFWFSRSTTPLAIAQSKTETKATEITPGGNKAVLILADGSKIILDSAGNTTLATQGKTQVIKLNNGQLAYQHDQNSEQPAAQILYNTIYTPRGGLFEIFLPDGSHVWLNAESSLKFPAAFTTAERTVELTGEAYFEIAKNPKQPFKVYFKQNLQNRQQHYIEVLGTHFNINAYEDEASIKTTLLEGKVKISAAKRTGEEAQTAILTPGMQSSVAAHANIQTRKVDTEEIIAWRNGLFNFNKADIKTVMRQIARWYDVDVAYQGPVSNDLFEGEIPRNSTLTEVFKILELSAVHFKMEGRTVIVTP